MVRAILDGRKTVTRRVVRPCVNRAPRCPYGVAGDQLWVRETWWERGVKGDGLRYWEIKHDADLATHELLMLRETGWKKKPSIFLSRADARIVLAVQDVGIERLQKIDEAGARAEGFEDVAWFRILWDRINAKRPRCSWADNPWVWVVAFSLCDRDAGR